MSDTEGSLLKQPDSPKEHREKNENGTNNHTFTMEQPENTNSRLSEKLRSCMCKPCIMIANHENTKKIASSCLCHPYLIFFYFIFVILFVLFPLGFKISPILMQNIIFLNGVSPDVLPLENSKLYGARNFNIEVQENIAVGVWHILPRSLVNDAPSDASNNHIQWFEESLTKQYPIVLYLHGNGGSRSAGNRVGLYNVLRRMDYHVIAFDYRGFGDSSAVQPTEEGLVNDTIAVYHYLKNKTISTDIYIWGHSLGTGVATHAVRDMCLAKNCPSGMILEAPFNSMADVVRSHPLTFIFRWLPYFDWAVIGCLKDGGMVFASEDHIRYVTTRILILAAEDDPVIPFKLAKSLYNTGLQTRNVTASPIDMIEFPDYYGYGHLHIYLASDLPAIIKCKMREDCSDLKVIKDMSDGEGAIVS